MNINELVSVLQEPFTQEKGFGITKLNAPDWENIYFIVPPPPPKKIDIKSLPHQILAEAIRALAKLPSVSEMDELDKIVNYLFVRREVVQSSRLEGTWSTIDHALTPGSISDEEEGQSSHQAVRSYAKLLEEIIKETNKKKESIFTVDFICRIQKSIVENDSNSKGIPGKLRTHGEPGSIVTIGGSQRKENSIYNPTPPKEVVRCLEEVLEWLRDTELAEKGEVGGGLSLPVRLAIAHSHFEAVHPFTDGNGRAGRSLWPLQMVCAGTMPLYLSGYVEEYKDQYAIVLQEAQKKLNYIPIIEFICEAIVESSLEAKKTKDVIRGLPEMWQERGKFRANSAARKALTLLLTSPIITSAFLEKELNIKKTTADDAIKSLVNKKILRFRERKNRHKVYAAEELIQIISRPFGSDIDLALEKAQRLLNDGI